MTLNFFKIPFINLLIAVILGSFLRYLIVGSIPGINFNYLVHAHSHVAFLGWVYLFFFIAILKLFLPTYISLKKYKYQFWLTQISVMGMLFTFPITGYAAVSIAFSTMHIFLSWWYIYSVNNDIKTTVIESSIVSYYFLRAAFLFLFISSIGPFALGFIMAKGMGGSDWYDIAIYYYLHFQYNGWFSFALFACLFRILEQKNFQIFSQSRKLFHVLFYSCILTFALSVLFARPPLWVYLIGLLGALLQIYSLFIFKNILPTIRELQLSQISKVILSIVYLSVIIKFVFQFFSVFADVLHIRFFVIGYLHLVLLGFISLGIFMVMVLQNWIKNSILFSVGILCFIVAFIGSEIFIFLQGTGLFFKINVDFPYSQVILGFSLLMVTGIITVVFGFLFQKNISEEGLLK